MLDAMNDEQEPNHFEHSERLEDPQTWKDVCPVDPRRFSRRC